MQLLIIYLGVGNMPQPKVKDYCDEVRNSFREALGLEVKLIILPQVGGESRVEVINLAI